MIRVSATGALLLTTAMCSVLRPAEAKEVMMAANLADLSIEELATIEITSVSKRAEPLSGAPAAVYVITNDDIRRYGARSLPETLRLAPNLQVARLDALSYAISARGFNSLEASNKLLVLLDGRSVYSPLHSGVFWDAQHVILEDVERIEVISGPGGTLWGANAVNGVINVITKSSAETQGALISGSIGTVDRDISGRYGFGIGDDLSVRGYVNFFERGNTKNQNGTDHVDDWHLGHGGITADWTGAQDTVRLQGEVYDSSLDVVASDVSGGHGLFRWTHNFGTGGPLEVQAYYDRTNRQQPPGIEEAVETYHVELQHSFDVGGRHAIVWGGGYRVINDHFVSFPFGLGDPDGTLRLLSVFAQDEIALSSNVKLTAGLKLEHHTFTGWEYMPNARIAWQVTETALLWGAISRAVRTPSRIDRGLQALPFLVPAPDFRSERLVAYEVGYRGNPFARFMVSLSGFYNEYDDLRTTELTNGTFPAFLGNNLKGHTYGAELWGQYGIRDWWRASFGVNVLDKNLRVTPGIVDTSNFQAAGNDPSYQFQVRSLMTPIEDVDVDIGLRVVDKLTSPVIPGYTELDARVAWRVTSNAELYVAGFNLLHSRHPEAGPAGVRREMRRSVNGGLRVTF